MQRERAKKAKKVDSHLNVYDQMSRGLLLLGRHGGGARSRSMATLFPPAASGGRSTLFSSTSRFALMVIIHEIIRFRNLQ